MTVLSMFVESILLPGQRPEKKRKGKMQNIRHTAFYTHVFTIRYTLCVWTFIL